MFLVVPILLVSVLALYCLWKYVLSKRFNSAFRTGKTTTIDSDSLFPSDFVSQTAAVDASWGNDEEFQLESNKTSNMQVDDY